MPTQNPFPLALVEKVNSPELEAYFQQFGLDKYLPAQDINKIIQGLNYLFENMGGGSGGVDRPIKRIFSYLSTYQLLASDHTVSLILEGDQPLELVFTESLFPIGAELQITNACDGAITFPGLGGTYGNTDIPLGSTMFLKQVMANYWIINYRYQNLI